MNTAAKHKWRPTLAMIVTAMIGSALLLPLFGIVFFRLYEDRLIQSTEAELIAQSAVLSATMSELLQQAGVDKLTLGTRIEKKPTTPDERWKPTLPTLSLSTSEILPNRPDAKTITTEISPIYRDVGETLLPILLSAQQQTLAGFRVLDFNGTIIAGRHEYGQSLANITEIQSALNGRYTSQLRARTVDDPQPIYSISRGTTIRIFTAMPVIVGDKVAGVIYASRTPSNIVKELYALRFKLALLGLAIAIIVGLMIIIFARAILNPIHELTARAIKIGKGDRNAIEPLDHYGSREVYRLANELFGMSEKLFLRQDYINTFATHVSHELKSPLTSIHGAAELLIDQSSEMTQKQHRKFLNNILQDTQRSEQLLDRLRQLAIAENPVQKGNVTMEKLFATLKKKSHNINLQFTGDMKTTIGVTLENAMIVFSNLVENAVNHDATSFEIQATSDGGETTITLRDNGSGISAANAQKIFELFFTTRREKSGTGMGLGIVQAILKAHAGSISLISSIREEGSVFEIKLPTAIE